LTKNKKLVRNSVASIAQIVIAGGTLFLLYAFLIRGLGAEIVGVWSFVMAISSLARIGEVGLTGSVVKYVAKHLATAKEDHSALIVQTALLWVLLGVGVAVTCFYPLFSWVLKQTLDVASFAIAETLLPYACVFYVLSSLVSVLHFALDGCHQITIRSIILSVSAVLFLLLALVLVPIYGLLGLLISQIIQVVVMGVVSYYFVRKSLPSLPLVPYRWSKDAFKEMIGYGIHFNTISIAEILFEPSVKYMLAKFGGLSSVVYYEMASRLVIQLRAAFVAVNKALVPYISELCETSPEQVSKVYVKTYSIQLYFGVPVFGLIATAGYFISYIWMGYLAVEFVFFLILLSAGWFLNALSVPSFYSNLGTGQLKWNVLSYLLIIILTFAMGHALGPILGSYAVVLAWVLSLIIGSFMVMHAYHRQFNLRVRDFLPAGLRVYFLLGVLSVLVCLYPQLTHTPFGLSLNMFAPIIFAMFMVAPFWRHPLRRYVFEHLQSGLSR